MGFFFPMGVYCGSNPHRSVRVPRNSGEMEQTAERMVEVNLGFHLGSRGRVEFLVGENERERGRRKKGVKGGESGKWPGGHPHRSPCGIKT